MSNNWTATTYSNPRGYAEIANWPIGRDRRATAVFELERDPKRGQRVSRTTVGKTVKTTYVVRARIVTGDDGQTYIAELTSYGHISIMRGDMKYSHGEPVFENDPRYPEMRALFD